MTAGQAQTGEPALSAEGALESLYRQGDYYGLLSAARQHLAEHPADEAATLLAARAWAGLGLYGPARELLATLPAAAQTGPEVHSLQTRVARMPTGRLAWGALQANFDANSARLYARYPELQAHDELFRGIPRSHELFRSSDGNLHLSRRSSAGVREWLGEVRDYRGAVAALKLPHDPQALFSEPYLVAGDRWGLLLERAFQGTARMFMTFTPRIYVLEEDPALFGASLYVHTAVDNLVDERVHLFCGADCVDRLDAFFAACPGRGLPGYALSLNAAGEQLSQRAYQVLRARQAPLDLRTADDLAAIEAYYAALPAGHWRQRFDPAGGASLRVLGITSRFTTYLQYSMRDWAAAFRARGHEFRIVAEASDHDLVQPEHLAAVVAEYRPDLVAVIDHLRREYPALIKAQLPFVCWIQDALPNLTTTGAGGSQGPLDFFIAPHVPGYARTYGYPAARGLNWSMATNEDVYSADPLPAAELDPWRCAFSYVSSHSRPPELFYQERRRMFSGHTLWAAWADYFFAGLTRRYRESPRTACGRSLNELYYAAEREIGESLPEAAWNRLCTMFCHPLCELLLRQTTLEWVADYCDRTGRTLHLYGNGWEDHPRFARYARGFARNGAQLRAIHQASTINLQITNFGAIHQRLLDGLAAGGFFLLRYCPTDAAHDVVRRLLAAVRQYGVQPDVTYRAGDVPEFACALRELSDLHGDSDMARQIRISGGQLDSWLTLEESDFASVGGAVFPGYAEVAFGSADELVRQADRYLDDANARTAVVEQFRPIVLNRFTYQALVGDLLHFMHARLADSPRGD